MNSLILEIIIIGLLIVANGMFAMAEIAIVSARKTRLQQLADQGDRNAQAALSLAETPNQFLATVQIGITLIGILAGVFGGATLAEEIAVLVSNIAYLAPYAGTIGVGLVVLGITFTSLVIGELVPKRLGLNNPERVAAAVASPMRFLTIAATPVVRLLELASDLIIRLLGVKPSLDPAITPEEVKILIKLGTESGIFEASEQDMIEGVLRLDERRLEAFMTSRTQIVWLDIEDALEDVRYKIAESRHAHFPVSSGSREQVLGIVHVKDILNQSLAGEPLELRVLMRAPLFLPGNMSALKALELFRESGTQTAMIVDEYGGIVGMATHNGILAGIAGKYSTAGLPVEPQAVRRADGSWLIDGLLHIEEFKDLFDLDALPGEEYGIYHTLGGFVISQVGNIPAAGQSFVWENLQFEVVDMDGPRVDKLLVAYQHEASP